jgi:hypothetical protein
MESWKNFFVKGLKIWICTNGMHEIETSVHGSNMIGVNPFETLKTHS